MGNAALGAATESAFRFWCNGTMMNLRGYWLEEMTKLSLVWGKVLGRTGF